MDKQGLEGIRETARVYLSLLCGWKTITLGELFNAVLTIIDISGTGASVDSSPLRQVLQKRQQVAASLIVM